MRSTLLSALALGSLAGCGADPAVTPSQTLVVETFNVGLAGAFVPNEAERTRAVPTAVAGMSADIVCLQEAWRQEDKDAITAAARARFPHAYSARHDLSTAVTQEIDPMCGGSMTVPAEPTTPPCADPSVMGTFASGITCLINNCSTMPGSDQGRTTSTACATARCIGDVASLLTAGSAGLRCYGCLAPQLTTETFAGIRTSCTTNPRAGLAFNGQSGTMILSRYPLSETETVVIPGTWNRRVITRATATLPDGSKVGVYCNHLSPVFEGVAFPYTGRYGCGDSGRDGWSREQTAQARELIAYVRRRDSAGRAVILGDFNTSAASAPGQPTITEEAPETYTLLRAAFREAIPAGFVPQCTYCPDNALTGNAAPTWLDHVFLQGFTEASVRAAERTFTNPTVAVSGGAPVPLSDHYGMRATLSLAP
jgi:endonuclease/exonuclease/phosphatase family metal-dependent hydrolase